MKHADKLAQVIFAVSSLCWIVGLYYGRKKLFYGSYLTSIVSGVKGGYKLLSK